jgi:hypothetical protein
MKTPRSVTPFRVADEPLQMPLLEAFELADVLDRVLIADIIAALRAGGDVPLHLEMESV